MTPGRPLTQFLGLILSGMVLLGQVTTFVHLASVRHVTCAEHGELVHASDDVVRVGAAQVDRPGVRTLASSGEQHGHDHCLNCALRRETLTVPLSAQARVDATLSQLVLSANIEVRAHSSWALLQAAPKTSPPA